MPTFEELLAEGESVPVEGWDFSWFEGRLPGSDRPRATEERPPWGYSRLLGQRLAALAGVPGAGALDLQTGGGEVLAAALKFVLAMGPAAPPTLAATESWPPNAAVARRHLASYGAQVAELPGPHSDLPFPDATFDLVSSRHPLYVRWDEVARVLKPGGRYLSQDVGHPSVGELSEFMMGAAYPRKGQDEPTRDPKWSVLGAERAGLDVVGLREFRGRMEFNDVGAVVVFLRKVIWIVPGFTVAAYRDRLRALHEQIERDGPFRATSVRFLIEARRGEGFPQPVPVLQLRDIRLARVAGGEVRGRDDEGVRPQVTVVEAGEQAYQRPAGTEVVAEAGRRRAFAVISHPDAGKSTLTEALALHASAITQAGAVHGKAGRRGVTSDWMAMERDRGISITSAALRFDYDGMVLNLLDTPGHADFSEDTYRVLEAVDCAIMLLDSAKGLEPQTLKLFDVCRNRHIPVITFVNKWDRPGREPLELLDEIEQRIGLRPTPLNWPVGVAGDFHGLVERSTGEFTKFTRTPGGADRAIEEHLSAEQAALSNGAAYTTAMEELELLTEIGAEVDLESFLAGESSPVLFGAALPNFGVRRLLESLVALAPAPAPRTDVKDEPRPVDAPFSGLVFKVQANMDRNHRDRVAFVRVCSGRFERGMVLTHAATGRPFATKYAQSMFGAERETLDVAYPGDVIGLVNATALRPGDTLYDGLAVEFPPIPSFAPEHFAVVRSKDASKHKQFRKGIDQLATEGVVQVLSSDVRGDQAPVLAAVGPLQFDVVLNRLEHEFGARAELEHLSYTMARRTDPEGAAGLAGVRGSEVLTRRLDGALLALFTDKWRLAAIQRDHPGILLEALVAGTE